jgi:hypothetical protein
MKSIEYYVLTDGFFGKRIVKSFGNLLDAKRYVVGLLDGKHYQVMNSNIVLFSI